MTPIQAAKSVARDPFIWPGRYPRFLIMADGGSLCPACVKQEFRQIVRSTASNQRDGWAAGVDCVNLEDDALACDHCGKHIPSAYGEDK